MWSWGLGSSSSNWEGIPNSTLIIHESSKVMVEETVCGISEELWNFLGFLEVEDEL